jgi:hypothetical protein
MKEAAMKHFLVLAFFATLSACNKTEPPAANLNAPAVGPVKVSNEEFLPIHANFIRGQYFVAGCEQYRPFVPQVMVKIPTAQEAELAGFRRSPLCSAAKYDERIAGETRAFGELKSSLTTETLRSQLLLSQRLGDVQGKQSDAVTEIDTLKEEVDSKVDKR